MHELAALAAIGGRFVRLARREKRPLGAAWQTKWTDNPDDVDAWLQSGSNVGLLLGPGSGLIDVEFDTPAGPAELERLGLTGPTPTWRSARGEHRLYWWQPDLPPMACCHVGGLEVRIGGRAAQSVLPPSRHPDGTTYRWTTSPADCPVAAIPATLMEELCGQPIISTA